MKINFILYTGITCFLLVFCFVVVDRDPRSSTIKYIILNTKIKRVKRVSSMKCKFQNSHFCDLL